MFSLFKTDIRKIINKLAQRSLKADSRRNLFIIITIAFAAGLMVVLSLYTFGSSRESNLFFQGRYQTALHDVGPDMLPTLLEDKNIETAGVSAEVTGFRDDRLTVNVNYRDNTDMGLHSIELLKGRLPEKENELAVPSSYLEKKGLEPKIGQTISLDLGTHVPTDYTVCGITRDEDENEVYELLVSQSFLDAYFSEKNIIYTTDIRMAGSDSYEREELKQHIKDSLMKYVPRENAIIFSSAYFHSVDNSSRDTGVMLIVALLIVIACATVIYSLFYISVTGKIKEYGRLRIIGMTQKQIRQMVKKEGRRLSLLSIPTGVFIGCIIGYAIVPKGWYWPNTFKCALAATLLTEIAVLLAVRKPMKLASSVSPIEAVRISSTTDTTKKLETQKLFRKITPYTLAKINFSRNRKKVTLTLISLGFTGLLLMCGATILTSADPVDIARQSFGNKEFVLFLSPNDNGADSKLSEVEAYDALQRENPLNDKLIQSLSNNPKIAELSMLKGCNANVFFPGNVNVEGNPNYEIIGLSKEDITSHKGTLLSGSMDYDELMSNHGILIDDSTGIVKRFGHYDAKLGDKIEIETESGEKISFTVMGTINIKQKNTNYEAYSLYIPQELLNDIKNNTQNFNMELHIKTDINNLSAVENYVYETCGDNQNIGIRSLRTMISYSKKQLRTYQIPIYGVVIFIAAFSLINLINTLMTNLVSRQQEFGVLQSIGLSGKQLSKMLQAECFYYVVGTMVITLITGTIGGYILCQIFSQIGLLGKLTYTFPILPIAIFFVALILIAFIYSIWAIYYCRKQSVVERIKAFN